eukprot:TRINITY_DN8419_c0_g1_i1.p1 TRINITY_DN8419_c0_g1~~TRINITY_DN8419_c0_g1_i1.p1  ORF type:complete len:201 (+),score=80.19 TRINITY_DN8419_c0_g1_i1:234-836(+)
MANFLAEHVEEKGEASQSKSRSRDRTTAQAASSLEVEQCEADAEQLRLFKQAQAAAEMHEERRAALDARQRRAALEKAAAAAERERIWQAQEQHRMQQEQEERKKLVHDFLKRHGFGSISSSKRSLMSSTYPLHKAAELGDTMMVYLLLQEGADRRQKNSSGRTAAQVAEKRNKAGSHSRVLAMLVDKAPYKSASRHGGA